MEKVEIAGSEVSLKIADQTLNGDFIFKNNNDVTQLNIENGSVNIGSGYIVVENISGDLLIDKSGVAGFLMLHRPSKFQELLLLPMRPLLKSIRVLKSRFIK